MTQTLPRPAEAEAPKGPEHRKEKEKVGVIRGVGKGVLHLPLLNKIEKTPKNEKIAGGTTTAGAGLTAAVGVAYAISSLLGPNATPPAENPGTSQGDTGTDGNGEQAPAPTASEQLASNIAERAEPGSPEYQALVDSYELNASQFTTPDAVLEGGAHVLLAIEEAGFAEIPETLYDESLADSIDTIYEKTDPEYWNEVYSLATYGKPSSELTGDQLDAFNGFIESRKTLTQQRIITADEDNPTSLVILSESTDVEFSNATQIKGTHSVTINYNADNSLQYEEGQGSPQTDIFGGLYLLDPSSSNWYWTEKH